MTDQETPMTEPADDQVVIDAQPQPTDEVKDRGQQLRAKHGTPKPFDTETALRGLGLALQIHPIDAIAFAHNTRESADEFAQHDRDDYGHTVHVLPLDCDLGYVVLIDLRPALERMGVKPKTP